MRPMKKSRRVASTNKSRPCARQLMCLRRARGAPDLREEAVYRFDLGSLLDILFWLEVLLDHGGEVPRGHGGCGG
jgi:hypothetical protein